MTNPVPVPVSQFPNATLPLTGNERMPFVQNGITVQAPSSAIGVFGTSLVPELFLAVAAGTTDNLDIDDTKRLFIDTAAGDATLTGFAADPAPGDGQPLIVTNAGSVNLLTLAVETGSIASQQLYGVADITLPPHGSQAFYYSSTLAKWVMS